MAEYIDRNLIEWYGCNFEDAGCENRDCSGCSHAKCSHSQVMQIHTADVIERSEYEYLKKENRELAIKYDNAMNMVINEQENVTRLRGKIDKAKKQITDSMNEHLASDGTPIDEYAYCYLNALEILEENIGE